MSKLSFRTGILFVGGKNGNSKKFKEIINHTELLSVVKDEVVDCTEDNIQNKLISWCNTNSIDVIMTFGGVEFSPLDIVPEVTSCVIEKEILILTLALFQSFLQKSDTILLTRGVCGIRKKTLIINLLNDINHLQQCLQVICPCLPQLMRSLSETADDFSPEFTQETENKIDPLCTVTEKESENEIEMFNKSNYVDSGNQYETNPDLIPIPVFEDEDSGDRIEDHTTEIRSTHAPEINEDQTKQFCDNKSPISPNNEFPCTLSSQSDTVNEMLTKFQASHATLRNVINANELSCDIINLHNYNLPASIETNSESEADVKFITSSSKPTVKRCLRKTLRNRQSLDETSSSKVDADEHVYDFDDQSNSEEEFKQIPTRSSKRKSQKTFKKARIYQNDDQNKEVCYVPVGEGMTDFLNNHPVIQGIHLNKGKRQIKKTLVTLKRQESAVDKGSWERKGHTLERNRFDDYFEVTELGAKKGEDIGNCLARDEYVVNWYIWCPGHGNCHRKCGGYGQCLEGCNGMAHKQDRHNCSFLVNLKIFLSDLSKWRVQLTGSHVPDESSIPWQPPARTKQRLDQSTKDFVISQCESQNTSTSNIQEAYIKAKALKYPLNSVLPKRKISRMMWNLKRRKSDKNLLSNNNDYDNSSEIITPENQKQVTLISIPSVQSNIPQVSAPVSYNGASNPLSNDQSKVIIINPSMLTRTVEADGTNNMHVSELIQNSEMTDGEMSNSDLRAVLMSLYNQA